VLTSEGQSSRGRTSARRTSPKIEAVFRESVLGNTDLSRAKGLESCLHLDPSIIDLRALQKSGRLSKKLLRDCGLPDNFIEQLPTLLADPISYSCFIGYSTNDQEFADRLHADLQDSGVRSWFAPQDIKDGEKLHEQIDRAMASYHRLLLILSEHSMNSKWVKTEIAEAREREAAEGKQLLIPIRLVDYERIKDWQCFDADRGEDSAREIREYFIPDFTNWKDSSAYQKSFDRLLRDLKASAP